MNSKDHTTLVAAVKAAGLVETLQGKGPFTVFAPTNAAFAALPAGTVETLLKPENKADADQGADVPRRGRATPTRRTLAEDDRRRQGHRGADHRRAAASCGSMMNGTSNIIDQGREGRRRRRSRIYDVMQSNGVIHVVDRVLMPK